MFSTFTAVIIVQCFAVLDYNYNGYCGEYNRTILLVEGNFIYVTVGNKTERIAPNSEKNATFDVFNVSFEATRVTSDVGYTTYNFITSHSPLTI